MKRLLRTNVARLAFHLGQQMIDRPDLLEGRCGNAIAFGLPTSAAANTNNPLAHASK
jgi:hypothetical protein